VAERGTAAIRGGAEPYGRNYGAAVVAGCAAWRTRLQGRGATGT
jgi:hypothetical protein